jgi:hypothetical protein
MPTQLANDMYGRSVSISSSNGVDTYIVSNGSTLIFTLEFPTGTPYSSVEQSINLMGVTPAAPTPTQVYTGVVNAAMVFGQNLVVQYSVENILSGITQAGQTIPVATYLQVVSYYLNSGSLYAALTEIATLIADTSSTKAALSPYVTNNILYNYLNQIQTYLNLPITENPGP